ncbi:hypothetical protein MMC17_004328 [Xylographa soralifera]|nr:hypothetical protein [Xylographa soralifera]
MAKQNGLEWVARTFGLEPRWTVEPNIAKVELLARKHLQLEQNACCNVTFYAQGAFNKLYKIKTETRRSLMRVTLPVDPSNKTNSEVATITFVRQTTDIPVPQIITFDNSSENELGFEWILMEMLPGETLRTRWRKLSEDAKRDLVKQVAKYQAQLCQNYLPGIGNIFVDQVVLPMSKQLLRRTVAKTKYEVLFVDRLVSMIFFWGDHIAQDVSRGPFENSQDWIRARLSLVLTDQERILKTSDNKDDIENSEDAKEIVEKLLKLLPSVFPSNTGTPELNVLFHDDLSMQNILVDDHEKITSFIDWECVSALPLWRACELSVFLKGRDRNEEPKRAEYAPDNGEDDAGGLTRETHDNEGVNSLYWEHLLEYELTMLRGLFLKEMEMVMPEWIEISKRSAVQADFEEAVQNCDNGWRTRKIKSWLDALENSRHWDLRRSFLE